jgi:hypothetical protein
MAIPIIVDSSRVRAEPNVGAAAIPEAAVEDLNEFVLRRFARRRHRVQPGPTGSRIEKKTGEIMTLVAEGGEPTKACPLLVFKCGTRLNSSP